MDSFKLVPLRRSSVAIAAGAVARHRLPARCTTWLLSRVDIEPGSSCRYVAPVDRGDCCKAVFIVLLLWRQPRRLPRRCGGAGIRRRRRLRAGRERGLPAASRTTPALALWLVRGLGTAVLHGATTAVFAMVSEDAVDRPRADRCARARCPGWLLAIGIHSGFNHLLLPPLAMTALLLLVLPLRGRCSCSSAASARRASGSAPASTSISSCCDLVALRAFRRARGSASYLQELRDALQRPGRRRHVLPAAARAGALGAGEGDAAGARGRAERAGRRAICTTASSEIDYLASARSAAPACSRSSRCRSTSDRDRWHRHVLIGDR